MLKARDIGEGLCVSSRNISGALRKLVDEGEIKRVGNGKNIHYYRLK